MPNVFTPPCPACGGKLRDCPAENATSRFHTYENAAVYICSNCGIAEAFSAGSFWNPHDTYPQAALMLQPRWRASWAMRP